MSKTTDTEMKELIKTIDRKVDLLTQKVDILDSSINKLDSRLWAFIGIILVSLLGAFLKAFEF
jgi:hypothetical protein